MTVKLAINTIDLRGSFKEKMDFFDSIEMVVFSFFAENGQVHLVLCDIVHMPFSRVDEIRSKVSQVLCISDKEIILHFTHDHTAPSDLDMNLDQLVNKIVSGIQENKKNQEKAKMAFLSIDTEGTLNVNRRKEMPYGMGKFTVWTGCEEKDGKLDGSRIAIRRLKDWMGEDFELDELTQPLFYDDERDTKLQAVLFKDKNEKMLGSLVRFCGHPAVANHTTNKRYSADFPGEIRRIMKEKFGGEHGFLTGPCGNIIVREKSEWLPLKPSNNIICMLPTSKMKDENDCFIEAKRIASTIVGYIEKNLPKKSDYTNITVLKNQMVDFKVELRKDLIDSIESAKIEFTKIIELLRQNRDKYTLSEIKKLTDKANFYDFHDSFYNRNYLDQKNYQKGFIIINIPSFSINDLIMQGMPGESFWQTATPIQNWADENKIPLITFSFANGSILYLPTDEERVFGDYEATLCICKEGVVTKLAHEILNSGQTLHKS